jgi:hypothetical protein
MSASSSPIRFSWYSGGGGNALIAWATHGLTGEQVVYDGTLNRPTPAQTPQWGRRLNMTKLPENLHRFTVFELFVNRDSPIESAGEADLRFEPA